MSSAGIRRRFHFIRQIASGGFGSVYLAKVVQGDGFSRLAAVKLLHPQWSENPEVASRMRDEARLLGWLRHRNIVEVFDLTRIEGRVAVIMEYLEAVDARVALEEGPLPFRAVLELGAAVASALDAAYNRPPYTGERPLRVVHRDIKPSNIMIDGAGTVKVLDFGVARAEFAERESLTQEMHFGSLDYMPPERLFHEPDSDRSDVYSLGATLYELLAGERLGKALTRPEAHAERVEERLEELAEGRDTAACPWPELRELLASMLGFEAMERPRASDCVSRLRRLARACEDRGTEEWAERVIPPLVQASIAGQLAVEADLVDAVLTEDISRAFAVESEAELPGEEDVDLSRSEAIARQKWQAQKAAYVALADLGSLTPSPPPPAPQPASGGGGSHTAVILVAFSGGGVLLLLGLGLIAAALVGGGLIGSRSVEPAAAPSGEVAQAQPEVPEPSSPVPAASPVPAGIEGSAVVFTSALPSTRRLSVRCDRGQAEGEQRAVLAAESPGSCTVTAVAADRRRHMAVIDEVDAGSYRCFEDGESGCN